MPNQRAKGKKKWGFYVTQADMAVIKDAANAAHMTMSDFVKMLVREEYNRQQKGKKDGKSVH